MIATTTLNLGQSVYFWRKQGNGKAKLRRGNIESFLINKDGLFACIKYTFQKSEFFKVVPINEVYEKKPKNEQANKE